MIEGCAFSCLILVIVCIGNVVLSATPILTPETVDVMENTTVALTCTSSVTERASFWQTTEYPRIWAVITLTDNGTCLTSGFSKANNNMYLGKCSGNGVFTVTILKTDETQHNKTWRCRTGLSDISNDVTVYVKVPVKYVDITTPTSSVLMLKETRFYSFTCLTSYSRPAPSVEWLLQSAGKTEQISATSSDILTRNAKQFISVKNELNISFGREKNGGVLYCNASNGLGVAVSSRKISLNVTFPPDGPPVIIGAQSGSRYKIVEHKVAHLSCTVSGGNPLANVIWFCLNGNISEIRESNTVTSNITWTALRNQQNTQCVCVAEHMFGNRNTSVSVDILYKASVLQFYIGESTDKNSFTVSEDENVIFSCIIEGNTPPNVTLSHNGRIIHVSVSDNSLVYTKKHIQCYDSGLYICTAMNEYNNGKSSGRKITLYVYCSPRPFPFFELTEKVNSSIYTSATLSFSALAFPEPGFTWYNLNGSQPVMLTDSENVEIIRFSSQSVLTIRNVTQSDYGQYFLLITNLFGVYEQNYSIEPQITSVSTTVSKIVPNTSSTVAFVAVGVGTFVAALILFGSALFVYRCFRRRRDRLHNVHKNHRQYTEKPLSVADGMNEVAEYEQIAIKSAETRTSVSDKRESVTSDEPTKQYERLDESRKETGQYSQLPALYEQMQTSRENNESGSVDIKETHHAMKDYINIRI